MKHVVFYSGGTGSWAAAHRIKRRFGTEEELREDVERSCDNTDPIDLGGCGCFVD